MTGLHVDGRCPGNVLGHVGDVHPQDIAALRRSLAGNRVVKVPRVNRVDGHARYLPQVATHGLRRKRRLNAGFDALGLGKDPVGEGGSQPMARDDALYGKVEGIRRPKPPLKRHHTLLAA